jgi:hypothetical protein
MLLACFSGVHACDQGMFCIYPHGCMPLLQRTLEEQSVVLDGLSHTVRAAASDLLVVFTKSAPIFKAILPTLKEVQKNKGSDQVTWPCTVEHCLGFLLCSRSLVIGPETAHGVPSAGAKIRRCG